MPVCQFCGLDSPGDSRFCGVCGRPFTNGPDASISRSGVDMQAPPPPPPPVPQRSSIPLPYPQGSGSPYTAPTTPSFSNNAPPPPPSGTFSGSGQQQPVRQSYPGMNAADGQPPTIRQSYPGPVGTPAPSTLGSNQPQMYLPHTNSGASGEFNTTPVVEHSSQYDGGNQKLQRKKRSSGLRILTIVIVLVIVLIGGVGSALALTYFHNKPSGGGIVVRATATTAPTPTVVPTATPTIGASPTASVTASATLTPTAGVTATATPAPQNGIVPQSPNLPLAIPCVNCSYPKLILVLSNITPDQTNPQVTDWNLTITNKGTSACSSVSFNQVLLEDQSGTQYQGQGQAGDTWTMNASQQQIESPTFQVVPQTGVRYTLNLSININNCNDNTSTTNTYQTESFTF
ncbi:MAG: hypothetical protein ABI406_09670 [Ktedonobacteraceae bacterium]